MGDHDVPPGPPPEQFLRPTPVPPQDGAAAPPPYVAPPSSPYPAPPPYPAPWGGPVPPPRKSGTGLAVVVGIAVAAAALGVGLMLVDDALESPNAGTTMEGVDESDPWFVEDLDATPVRVEDLAVGDCFFDGPYVADDDLGTSWEVDLVDCADEHALEVVGEFELTGERLPRQNEAFFSDLEERCWSAFDDNVAPGVASDDRWINFYWPSRQSWDQGDRLVTCVAATDRLVRGSLVRGSGAA
ncbi:septum formation family protein [Nocardioides zeae]|uniref:Septum formation-related domain-containing protein n=1 Tax=Nocardioides zeae TaxID=1457234 RepID=A0AAJ1WYU4_9ACTN|nr:septum formation family protein [Nocardioides zeae]MDQ1102983.1 hypothetical protein [Nocardioides zeae]